MDSFDLRLWEGFRKAGGDSSREAYVDQIAIDSRRIDSPHAMFIALQGNVHDGHKFVVQAAKAGARYAIVSDSWASPELEHCSLLRVKDPLKAFQEIARAYRLSMKCRVVCIAGSYGKTMVKDLLDVMTSTKFKTISSPESFNSQIGVPLSLLTIKKEHEVAFIEAGISHKNEMEALAKTICPDACILTHVGKKHLATLGDIPTAASEMAKIWEQPPSKEWVLLPKDPHILQHLGSIKAKHYFWNEISDDTPLPHAKSLSLEHNTNMPYSIEFPDGSKFCSQATCGFYYFIDLLNISVKAAWLLGIPSEHITTTLREYVPEPMRTEIWKNSIGSMFINDVYCSDPQSVDVALKHFENIPEKSRKIFIFGGMKGTLRHSDSDYRRVGKAIQRVKPHLLMLVGNHPYAPLMDEIKANSPETEIAAYHTSFEALQAAQTGLRPEDVILIKGAKKEPLDRLTEIFNDSICSNQCFINLAAVQSNIEIIRNRVAKGTRIMVMVKALAYGTDEILMARFLNSCGIDILGVSYVDEGVALKRAGVKQEIFVINAAEYEASKVAKWGLQVGVSNPSMVETLSAEAIKHKIKIKVHLHIDSGMSRFGCRKEDALGIALLIKDAPGLELEGVMTHFASADDPQEDAFTYHQAKTFTNAIQELEENGLHIPWKHAANSGGVLRFHFPQFNMVRIGLAVYGLYSSEATKQSVELRLALSLVSRIVGINICRAGETISYGRSYRVQKETQHIAVLPIGYFDGLHRAYSGKGYVIIRGQKAPMVGKICMDFMMVDITDIPHAAIGDPVLIFGEDEYGHYLSPEDLALRGDSIIHELITCLGPRIQRIFVYEEAHKTR